MSLLPSGRSVVEGCFFRFHLPTLLVFSPGSSESLQMFPASSLQSGEVSSEDTKAGPKITHTSRTPARAEL